MIKKIQGFVMLLVFWFGMYWVLKTPAIPSPLPTLVYTVQNISVLVPHLLMSFFRIGLAILISALVGTGLGVMMARNQTWDAVLAPLVYVLYPIPKIAFLPILMLLFGLGEMPKVILIVSIIIFQFMMSSKDAVRDINPAYFDSVSALGIKGWHVYKHLIVPAMLPSFFTALRVSVGVSIAVLFFGENFSTKLGIGYYIMNAYSMVNYQGMYAGIVALSVMGLLIFSVLDRLETKICPWKQDSKKT